MTVTIALCDFYHYASDIKTVWKEYRNIEEKDIHSIIGQCMQDEHFNNVQFPYTSILIDPEWQV